MPKDRRPAEERRDGPTFDELTKKQEEFEGLVREEEEGGRAGAGRLPGRRRPPAGPGPPRRLEALRCSSGFGPSTGYEQPLVAPQLGQA